MKNLRIANQIFFGSAVMIFFVIAFGIKTIWDGSALHQQTDLIYNHPVKVILAVREIEKDILSVQLRYTDFLNSEISQKKNWNDQEIKSFIEEANNQFEVLNSQYLGPKSDVAESKNAFQIWCDHILSYVNTSNQLSRETIIARKEESSRLSQLLSEKLETIGRFAQNKTTEFYTQSDSIKKTLTLTQVVSFLLIVSVMILICIWLYRIIRKPLNELTAAVEQFKNRNLSYRIQYDRNNEFGNLTSHFNELAQLLEHEDTLNISISEISESLLEQNTPSGYYHTLLSQLVKHTSSHSALFYELTPDKSLFEYRLAIGGSTEARKSFSADGSHGEFGYVQNRKKIVHKKNLSKNNLLTLETAFGDFHPSEMITIPIMESGNVMAFITLCTLEAYSDLTIKLLNKLWPIINANTLNIFSLQRSIDYADRLDLQNKELQQQSIELSKQSSELKQYTLELEFQKEQLVEANQMKSTFLSNMSHELRTPLNSVIALSGVLNRKLRDSIPEEEYSYLSIIEKNGKNLLKLINDILDLSRIEAGKMELEFSQFDPQSLVREVIETLNPLTFEKQLKIQVLEGPQMVLVSDKGKLYHILQNIVGNAIKFTDKGLVTISTYYENNQYRIAVSDTGIGISEDHLPYIFDEFRQVDGRSSRKYSGTGLGLAIANKYARLLGGKIEVESKLKQGTTFTIFIPTDSDAQSSKILHPALNDNSHGEYPEIPMKGTTQSTILIVEDSEAQIIQLRDILSEAGYNILVANNGLEALKKMQYTIPDAIILDLMMPDIDGFEVLNTIRSQTEWEHIPVLILSAKHVTPKELSFLKTNHVYQLIQKGDVNRVELIEHVRKMLASQTMPLKTSPAPNQDKSGLKKVLLIEDNQDNALTVKALIGQKYHLEIASNGDSGTLLAKSILPDLILLDISLPDKDGYEVCTNLKGDKETGHIPIIALTARAMKGDREQFLNAGFNEYMAKPIQIDAFDEMLNRFLQN